MRRVFPVAFLGALLAVVPIAFAQRGGMSGGHAGFAGHSFGGGFAGHSFGGGFAGSGMAPHSFGAAPRMFGTAPRMTWTSPTRAFAPGSFAPGYRANYGAMGSRSFHDGDHRGHYRSPYRGYGGYGGYPYYGNSWELLPWDLGYPDFTGEDGYDNGYSGDDAGPVQPDSAAAQPQEEPMPPPDAGYRPDYPDAPYQLPAAMPAAPVAPEPQLMLIFKDGHEQPIRNFVLTANSVIVMDQAASGRQVRIPLNQLNLPATEQAAQQQGLDFNPPA